MTQLFLLWVPTRKTLKYLFPKIVHPYVHCSGRDMETIQVFFDQGLGKEDVVHVWVNTTQP